MAVRLGELLLRENMVSPQQLQEALNHAKLSGGKIAKAFVSLGFVKDEEITSLLSRHCGVPSVDPSRFAVHPAIIKIIPAETARRYGVLPLSLAKGTLRLAMADPTNVFAIDDIKFMTGYNVEPLVASESVLEDESDRYYGPTRSLSLRRESGGGAPPAGGYEIPGGAAGGSIKQALDGPSLSVDDMAAIGGLSEIDLESLGEEDRAGAVKADEDEIDLGNLAKSADAAPVIKLVTVMLVDSLKRGASDIHVEPFERELRLRFRIDGILYDVMALPQKLREPLISRIKVMARLNVAQKRLVQRGRIKIKMKVESRSRDLDFRVSILPTLWGEKVVMRLLDRTRLMLDMTKLGFEPHSLARFRRGLSAPQGLLLLTGPPRSGKTNCLYSAIAALHKSDVNIMTAEDPVDFALPGIIQVEVNEDAGASIPALLRSFRRLDANVIAVGEIRESDAARTAVDLALDGRLVLGILEGVDATSAVFRLVNMDCSPWSVASAVNLIVAQRLVRRICSECKVDVTTEVPPKALIDIGFTPGQVGTFQVMKGRGCQSCNGTGYKGLVGLYEVMEITEGIRDLIMAGATAVEIKRKALEEGMLTLRMSGLEKIKWGVTTVEEVLRETVL